MNTNVIIPVNPISFDKTLSILQTLNAIDNITISLISLKSFFGDKESNDFVSNLINKAKSKHSIYQIWMDEIFKDYNIFPAIYPTINNEYKYFEIVKVFIPYIRELNTYDKILYIEKPYSSDIIMKFINSSFENKIQAITLENTTDIINRIDEDFKLHKIAEMQLSNFKDLSTFKPADTSLVLYNIKYFNEIFAKCEVAINRQTFNSIINFQRVVEFRDYMDAIISLCYNYNTINISEDTEPVNNDTSTDDASTDDNLTDDASTDDNLTDDNLDTSSEKDDTPPDPPDPPDPPVLKKNKKKMKK